MPALRSKSWFTRRSQSKNPEVLAEEPQQSADETNSALANQT
jgi:hypothetical protein